MKLALRETLLRKRDGIKPSVKRAKELVIGKRLFVSDDFKRAKTVLFYASFRTEVDTLKYIQRALKLGKDVALPLVDIKKRELKLYKIKDISELSSGYMGIPEPRIIKNREIYLNEVDIVILPGIGFDVKGNRLGYGAGYYDRLLSKSRKHITQIALAFEEQIVEEIPAESHDIRVDRIVTDKRLIRSRGKDSVW